MLLAVRNAAAPGAKRVLAVSDASHIHPSKGLVDPLKKALEA
jgi:hypothetical protein